MLIIENRAAIARFLEGEQIPFDDVWIPSASALAFVDAAVIRFLDTHSVQEHDGANVGLCSVRRHLGSYVRECAGVVVADVARGDVLSFGCNGVG
ncbi:MAG: hypothetical protein WB973_10820 [Thermoanaerobaculia bacterium]